MKELLEKITKFDKDRNWGQYHTPKNLAIALSVEANELLELFMWQKDGEDQRLTSKQITKIREEVGDVMIHIVNFCQTIGIDPIQCAHQKLEINHKNYPVEKSYGSSKKYNELE